MSAARLHCNHHRGSKLNIGVLLQILIVHYGRYLMSSVLFDVHCNDAIFQSGRDNSDDGSRIPVKCNIDKQSNLSCWIREVQEQ